ncbi:hypothetical protein [Streptomyces sp. NPDC088789]|uniref:hypothetical protein n=1 Tax=Streptomyces sp. NPDC088789 TaxID=3365899 RepID=UPI003807A7DB
MSRNSGRETDQIDLGPDPRNRVRWVTAAAHEEAHDNTAFAQAAGWDSGPGQFGGGDRLAEMRSNLPPIETGGNPNRQAAQAASLQPRGQQTQQPYPQQYSQEYSQQYSQYPQYQQPQYQQQPRQQMSYQEYQQGLLPSPEERLSQSQSQRQSASLSATVGSPVDGVQFAMAASFFPEPSVGGGGARRRGGEDALPQGQRQGHGQRQGQGQGQGQGHNRGRRQGRS